LVLGIYLSPVNVLFLHAKPTDLDTAIPDHPATPVNTRCCKMAFVNIFEKSSA
jgi:hypothetical protein